MNTRNVTIKTAAHESTERCEDSTSEVLQAGADHFSWSAEVDAAYWQDREKKACTQPEEITFLEFMDALHVMYPRDWQADAYGESFKLAELYCGNVALIYLRIASRYFKFRDVVTLPHVEIIRRTEIQFHIQPDRTDR